LFKYLDARRVYLLRTTARDPGACDSRDARPPVREVAMKLSLFYLPTYVPHLNGSVAQFYKDILEEIEFADQNGLDAVWFAEHHFFGYGGMIPSVPVLAATAAQRTRRIRIGSGVALIVLNDPLRVAEEFAMLNNLSGGRLDFGIGRAFQRVEYDAFGVPMDESRARFNEALEIILKAWSNEPEPSPANFDRWAASTSYRSRRNDRIRPCTSLGS
jgi:alkanesulfonate monooxygenase SsuD/methylene tetrahydromethanopterin reductase-like flavin-dependent oxidoreductase (luciferase family)